MFRSTLAYGRKGAVLVAISAVNIALWDIKGKHLNQPVFMLLGGRTKSAIPAYYSRLYTRSMYSTEDMDRQHHILNEPADLLRCRNL